MSRRRPSPGPVMPSPAAPRVLALVPARGGSKGLPRKNVLPLGGHPLIAWSIAAGLQAKTVHRTVCSTDDPEIAEVAARYGAEVPFMRPAELAQDDTLDLPVFQHALEWLEREQGWRADVVVQLRPTSPLRFPGQVDAAVRMLLDDPQATGVRTVIPAPANPYKMWLMPEADAALTCGRCSPCPASRSLTTRRGRSCRKPGGRPAP
jgi:CMP-N-acetylneuraminic acid synthetase